MKMRHRHNSQCTFFSALSKAVHNINIDFFFSNVCVDEHFCRFSWEADLLEKLKYASHEHTSTSAAQLFIFAVLLRFRFTVHKKSQVHDVIRVKFSHFDLHTLRLLRYGWFSMDFAMAFAQLERFIYNG